MGLFSNPNKQMVKLQREQMDVQAAQSDVGMVQQMQEQGSVAYDPQVSALILACDRKFLPWRIDRDQGLRYLPKEYIGLKEPISPDDIMSFLSPEEKKIVAEGYLLLQEYFTVGEKYGFSPNVIRAFNNVVTNIESFAHVSRMDGKNVKVSKSQYVEGTSNVTRLNNPSQKKDKLFGVI